MKPCNPSPGQEGAIRVLVVDDHDVVRSGLCAFLLTCEGIVCVGEAASGQEAVDLCAKLQPDVVLMDLVMPGMDGVEATRIIRQSCPKTQIVALTSFAQPDLVQRALVAGVAAYVLKDISLSDLARAIRNAQAGQATLSPEAARGLIQASRQPPPIVRNLSARELEILKLMAQGLSNAEIADQLVIAPSTVKVHCSRIFTKLNVTRRTQAISLALRLGLVGPEKPGHSDGP